MYEWMKKEKTLCFIGGAIAGLVGLKVVKAKKTRELTVKAIAKGMTMKDCLMEEAANMREEAEDICNEAKTVAKMNSENVEEFEEVAE